MADANLDTLCERYGIALAFHDIWGQEHLTSDATKRALLAAMDVEDDAPGAAPAPLLVQRAGEIIPAIDVPQATRGSAFRYRISLEDGAIREGTGDVVGGRVCISDTRDALPPGYHRLALFEGAEPVAELTLAVCPRACHRPDEHARTFGPAIQLYAIRSARNWGIGDFTDLARLIELAAAQGASFVGVNPLHEPFLHRPEQASPYSPSSRLALNPLYLDVEAIEDYAACATARDLVATTEFQAQLAALRSVDLVDYANVARVKGHVLALLFEHFRDAELTRPGDRGHAFRAFVEAQRDHVADAALFDALQADFSAANAKVWGWPAWPEAYRDRAATEVDDFARDYAHRVDFYLYLQWQADLQLERVAQRARECGMAIGLYRDLAVGANPGGAETWQSRHMFAAAAHVGAPPDEFNPGGQDWGLPPWNPHRLRESGYAPWLSLLRANMRHAGGLRIDHVMGLLRLYWIPRGMTPADGAYISYPLPDLLALLALESARHRCIVVGEDLGTVPDEVRAALYDAGVLSCRVLYFERDGDGGFVAPARYPAQALVSIGTHDLPTLCGFLQGTDLAVRDALALFPGEDARVRMHAQRDAERLRLGEALARAGIASAWPTTRDSAFDDTIAAHRFIARTPSALMTIQLEDVFAQAEQVNLPATTDDQYPNWRRKLALDLDDWERDGRLAAICAAIRGEGRGTLP